mmetsp:Transcript_24641/g.21868  ORF Transcript_24641/g.21868 Transcript_24641/m.21868 type:complete len:88 (+) Transcript_24641:742-1005(+)
MKQREIEEKMKDKGMKYEERRQSCVQRKEFLDMVHEHNAMRTKDIIEQKFSMTEMNKRSLLDQKCATARVLNQKSSFKNQIFSETIK